jgi:hypothetical protein
VNGEKVRRLSRTTEGACKWVSVAHARPDPREAFGKRRMQSSGEGYERGSYYESQDIAKGHSRTPVSKLRGILAPPCNRDVTNTINTARLAHPQPWRMMRG